MKKKLLLLIPILMVESPLLAQAPPHTPGTPSAPPAESNPEVIKTNSSYAFGFNNGRSFQNQMNKFGLLKEDIDREEFIKGFMDVLDGNQPINGQEALNAAMLGLHNQVQKREKTLADENLQAAEAFLASNKEREGIITTESGLQYEVLNAGEGAKHDGSEGAKFMVNYKGSLIDGSEFDASPEGSPVPVTLNVVPGFREALTLMPVGSKWKLFIKPHLGYGQNRRSEKLGPNSTLIFELELVEIQKAPPRPKAVSPAIQIPAAPKSE